MRCFLRQAHLALVLRVDTALTMKQKDGPRFTSGMTTLLLVGT